MGSKSSAVIRKVPDWWVAGCQVARAELPVTVELTTTNPGPPLAG